MVGDKLNFNWQEVFNKFSDDLANAFDLFTGNLKLTKVFKATIIEKINDTVYKVLYKNAEYKVKSYYDLIIGDIVWVCAPGGDWDSLFVQSYNGFLDRIVTTDKVVNNLTTNVAGTVLDGRMGKSLKDQLDTVNSNLDLKANASDLTWKSLFNGDITISNGTNITITSGTIGSYKEFVITSGAGTSSEWTRSYFSNAGIPFVINDVVSGTGIVNNNIVPISLKVASSTVFTALLGNNVRIRSIHGR
jgi:hypothetical protein